MADYLNISQIRYFSVYDEETKKLKYSKLNFNFDLYKKDFDLKEKSKLEVFDHFLEKNDTAFYLEPDVLNMGDKTPSYLKPTVLKPDLEKYFLPMTNIMLNYHNAYAYSQHPGYMNVVDPETYLTATQLVLEQFDTVFYKDNQVRRLQDYYYSDKDNIYSKYNFNFDLYSKDFKVYGNNLVVFTDFISRVMYASGTFVGAYGNGNPRGFKKYFDKVPDLKEYMNSNAVTSIYKNVSNRNEHNLDYMDYAKKSKLPDNTTLQDAREHYIRFGQFKRINLEFIYPELTSQEKNMNSVGTIFGGSVGAGFLYTPSTSFVKEIYCVTASHILSKSNLSTFKATFSIIDKSRKNISATAEFRVVGRDTFTDLLVGIYDPELPYNKSFLPDLSPYKPFRVDLESNYTIGESVYVIGNAGTIDNNALVEGTISDPSYSGDFSVEGSYIPESLLVDIKGKTGMSGAPIFKKNNDQKIVGMVIGVFRGFTAALSAFLLDNLITNIIARYNAFSVIYKNNPTQLTINTKRALVKRWLGAVTSYYHPAHSSQHHPALATLPVTTGLILHDFILGFDFVKRQFVFDPDTLTTESVTKLDGPLLTSNMYNKFIDSGKVPIVLKSASFIQGWIGQYAKYEFGKFGNQDAFYNFTYGWSATGTKPVPPNVADNVIVAIMGRINFEYYWFNGINWVLESEELNDDYSEEWFTVYKDSIGNKFYESKWSYPPILYSYDTIYVDRLLNNDLNYLGLISPLGEADPVVSNVSFEGVDDSNTYGAAMGNRSFGAAMGNRSYGAAMGNRSFGAAMGNRSFGAAMGNRSFGAAMGNRSFGAAGGNRNFGF